MFIVLSSHFCTRAAFCQPFNKRILYIVLPTSVRPSVHKKFFPIPMKFGMQVEVDDPGRTSQYYVRSKSEKFVVWNLVLCTDAIWRLREIFEFGCTKNQKLHSTIMWTENSVRLMQCPSVWTENNIHYNATSNVITWFTHNVVWDCWQSWQLVTCWSFICKDWW